MHMETLGHKSYQKVPQECVQSKRSDIFVLFKSQKMVFI